MKTRRLHIRWKYCIIWPRPQVSVFVWNRRFFLVTENVIFSQTFSRLKIFENAGFSFTCARTKTEVFEYDDVIHHLLLALLFHCLTFSMYGRKRFEYATCERVYFWKRSKKISVFKNIQICVDGAFVAELPLWSVSSWLFKSIERFHSCGQHLCNFIGTIESFYIRKEFKSHRTVGTPAWPPFHCFGTPIWPLWRHVKTLDCNERIRLFGTPTRGKSETGRNLGWVNFHKDFRDCY